MEWIKSGTVFTLEKKLQLTSKPLLVLHTNSFVSWNGIAFAQNKVNALFYVYFQIRKKPYMKKHPAYSNENKEEIWEFEMQICVASNGSASVTHEFSFNLANVTTTMVISWYNTSVCFPVASFTDLLLQYEKCTQAVLPQLPDCLDLVQDPKGKAAIVWMTGQYGEVITCFWKTSFSFVLLKKGFVILT